MIGMRKQVKNEKIHHWLSTEELLGLIKDNEMKIMKLKIKLKRTEEEIEKLNEEISNVCKEKNVKSSKYKIKEERMREIKEEMQAVEKKKSEINEEYERKLLVLKAANARKEKVVKERTLSEQMFSEWVRRQQKRTETTTYYSAESEIHKLYSHNLEDLKLKLHDLHVECSRLEKNDPLWFIENEAKEIKKEANERTIKLRRLIDLRESQ
jgi:hypothetical protein